MYINLYLCNFSHKIDQGITFFGIDMTFRLDREDIEPFIATNLFLAMLPTRILNKINDFFVTMIKSLNNKVINV